MEETIKFASYLTGHDEETIRQMYNDWKGRTSEPNPMQETWDKKYLEQAKELAEYMKIVYDYRKAVQGLIDKYQKWFDESGAPILITIISDLKTLIK